METFGDFDAAEEVLQILIQDNIPQLESQGGLPKTMSTIKFSSCINLGNIANKRNDLEKALELYISASKIRVKITKLLVL